MKTSLEHLPEHKQENILYITSVIKEVINPQMIILYGSYAKGTYVEDRYRSKEGIVYEYVSDYDFLVVTKDSTEKSYVLDGMVRDRVDRYRAPVNLEIHEIDYINEGLIWGQYFFTDIINYGICLFDKGGVQFVTPKDLTPREKIQISENYFEQWFVRGVDFLVTVDSTFDRGKYNICAFLMHQAAENLYYTTLLVFTHYKPKTHNLGKLKKYVKSISPDVFFALPEESKAEKHLFDLLKRGYIDARYKSDYLITSEEVIQLRKKVLDMQTTVEKACLDFINNAKQALS